jgi:hypothetical protein
MEVKLNDYYEVRVIKDNNPNEQIYKLDKDIFCYHMVNLFFYKDKTGEKLSKIFFKNLNYYKPILKRFNDIKNFLIRYKLFENDITTIAAFCVIYKAFEYAEMADKPNKSLFNLSPSEICPLNEYDKINKRVLNILNEVLNIKMYIMSPNIFRNSKDCMKIIGDNFIEYRNLSEIMDASMYPNNENSSISNGYLSAYSEKILIIEYLYVYYLVMSATSYNIYIQLNKYDVFTKENTQKDTCFIYTNTFLKKSTTDFSDSCKDKQLIKTALFNEYNKRTEKRNAYNYNLILKFFLTSIFDYYSLSEMYDKIFDEQQSDKEWNDIFRCLAAANTIYRQIEKNSKYDVINFLHDNYHEGFITCCVTIIKIINYYNKLKDTASSLYIKDILNTKAFDEAIEVDLDNKTIIAELEKDLKKSNNQYLEQKHQYDTLLNKYNKLNNNFQNTNDEINRLSSRQRDMNKDKESVQAELKNKNDKIAELQAQVAALTEKCEKLQMEVSKHQNSDITSKYNTELARNAAIQNELNSLYTNYHEKTNELKEKNRIIEQFNLEAENDCSHEEYEINYDKIKQLRAAIFGGFDIWQTKVSKYFKIARTTSVGKDFDDTILDNTDVIIIHTKYASHKNYFKIISKIKNKKQKTPIIRTAGNLDILFSKITEQFKQ